MQTELNVALTENGALVSRVDGESLWWCEVIGKLMSTVCLSGW